ncbi:fungal specific transcription factor domain-containing protein [Phanerochaete sordida]|uniref:Fungal specific transcription factor domain-containing protein n=1 Tax=Phanerochaete sordida TaxID=48140 RepID=A0A9P3GRF2_9APHY|nr:fungal specific transcription factor domain-containing protein [Phanerochaete sordida]
MKEERKPPKTGSGRGTYARQACNHCRRRKSKCDGQQPVCGPCRDSGRADECTWGRETAKKARTQQHFESLVNHIKSLEARVKELEGELSSSRSATRRSGSVSDATRQSSSLSPHPSPVTKFEEHDDSIPNGDDDLDSAAGSDVDSEIEQLIAPTRHLVLQNGDLEVYGPTSAYRLAPERHTEGPCPQETQNHIAQETSAPVFDWSRHLPPEAPLSRVEHDRLLDLLFRFCTSWCFRVIPSLFLRDMHRALTTPPSAPAPRLSHYSPMLHNSLLALATAYSEDPRVHDIEFRRMYARRAKSYLEKDCLTPNVSIVSALSLLSTFHSSRGEQSLGYLYAGMAGRMTQALGLQIDCSSLVKSGRIKESDMHNRNWAFWATFCQDVCWSLYIGRDCAMAPPKEPVIPVPFVDSEFDHEPWVWDPSGLPPQKSNIASVFQATCELLRIGRRVMDFVNGLGTDFRHPNLQVVSELDIELNAWKDSLAPEVDLTAATRPSALPHRLTVHLMFWWLFILLHRPFYRRTKPGNVDIDHVKLCNRAAENMMLLLGIWHNNYNLRYVSTTHVQFTFSAGTVFVLSAIQAISGPRLGRVTLASSLSQVETCLEYLSIIGRSWETAECAREILLNFFDETLKPRLLLRSGDANLKLELQNVDQRARARANSSASSVGRKRNGSVAEDASPSFAPGLSPPGPRPVSNGGPSMNELQYFPGSPTVSTLGWPVLTGPKEFFAPPSSTVPSPTVEHVSFAHHQHPAHVHPGTDMDLDVGYSFSLSQQMNMVADVVANGGQSSAQPTPADMMAFGVPELGVGYQFDPHVHPQIALDFSAEELAIMDQIVRQQGGNVMFAVGQPVG